MRIYTPITMVLSRHLRDGRTATYDYVDSIDPYEAFHGVRSGLCTSVTPIGLSAN